MNKKKDGKITLGMLKGKSVTTSVPSIAIKFHANAEQLEEIHTSEDENNTNSEKAGKESAPFSSSSNISEPETSPLRYLPRLVKRSTSIDVSQSNHHDASPPSDPWKFFADIRGKITKSVEEKITEIKARNQEEGSPHHKVRSDLKTIKDSKESSSVSDSEDLSESSISKTCGVVSTTEGVEMSSDDDSPSLEKDKKNEKVVTTSRGLTQRFRILSNKAAMNEGTIKVNNLSKLYNINMEKVDQTLPEDSEEVESAVDALEEANLNNHLPDKKTIAQDEILKSISQQFDNMELDVDKVINVWEIKGKEIRSSLTEGTKCFKTVFAPTGFVDLRSRETKCRPIFRYLSLVVLLLSMAVYVLLQQCSPYMAGVAAGMIISFILIKTYLKLYPLTTIATPIKPIHTEIMQVEAIKEYQPISKYEGWANEYPDVYNPQAYHISQTQSVYLRLQGNLLRISHSKSKVPKRAMWNEPDIKATFNHHRIYNLLGAKITLVPAGLAKKRHWSKKYPICITLVKDQMNFDPEIVLKLESDEEKEDKLLDKCNATEKDKNASSPRGKKTFGRFRKRDYPVLAQRFSKLTQGEEFEFDMESDSRASTPSAEIFDAALEDSSEPVEDSKVGTNEQNDEDYNSLPDDWSICSPPQDDSPTGTIIYIFGRTDREKEDWFRRFTAATHLGVETKSSDSSNSDIKESISDTVTEAAKIELEYIKYMSIFKPSRKQQKPEKDVEKNDLEPQHEDVDDPKLAMVLWINALIGRVLFDCMRDPEFTTKVKDRIQRKLYTIKLPYFIEEILIPELSLGKTPPLIQKTGTPILDERGLWIDLDIAYEGAIVLTLQTKLNLMRLKNPQAYDKSISQVKSAIYHSDVDDSAESSSDEEGPQDIPSLTQEASSTPLMSLGGGSGNSSKKFIKMVDRLAESKFFQAATENRYIKKAMEGVSNTDLRLTVEVKSIVGTLVLNIPPPPSDRVWVGFRPVPEILLSAKPIVGERNISYIMVTSWIEKKLIQEFQKIMVIPNMEDFVIPVMNPKLPN